MLDFTVAICTYNGAARLPLVLDKLKEQIHTENFQWEIIVIDNNSTDNTSQIIFDYQANWPLSCSLNYFFEPKQGLAYARQCAVEKATGKLIGFLDDDNLPDANWVASAYDFGCKHPHAGAYGGRILANFEKNPPKDFKRISLFLALIDRGGNAHIYERSKGVLPPAAGLVVRREVWLKNVPSKLFLVGRVNKSMLASEDLEALVYIQNAGWEIWYNPNMLMYHQIPNWRLERQYLISLVRGIGLARHHIRMLRLQVWQRPLFSIIYLINDIRRLLIHLWKYKGDIKNNLIASCEWEFLFSSLISPFYILWIHKNQQERYS
ncbi:hormogonium polysaccharide biosynthesis glycosyltransferase HpsE [Anabaena azotica]|uniref:Glycosyltransferase family 2 protein n=1 Tax=Anabaena azotica FACHB-119 TaxID=947527 RepID=A0ABR8DCA6_9NOST|nr:hormogonium polysaccharide biosynthesis glycosyltransferase HpsE [Anabaena azotica]MBD2504744.1 glycosyltransferase family 2 protein [Anabaena azotica FACHB-119]